MRFDYSMNIQFFLGQYIYRKRDKIDFSSVHFPPVISPTYLDGDIAIYSDISLYLEDIECPT